MTPDHFEATFVSSIDRVHAGSASPSIGSSRRAMMADYWLAGFDSTVTVVDEEAETSCAHEGDEPCAGTEIVVTLTDTEAGTRITVVQSRFGDWLPAAYEMMAVGWRHIVADLHTYLATGVPRARHLHGWGRPRREDVTAAAGGLRVGGYAGTSPTASASGGRPARRPRRRTSVDLRRLVTVLRVIRTLSGGDPCRVGAGRFGAQGEGADLAHRPGGSPTPSSSRTTRASRLGATSVYEVRTHSSTSRQRPRGSAGSSTDTQPWRPSP